MKDLAGEAREDPTATAVPDDDLLILNSEEEEVEWIQECEYCGHQPCGCGG